MNRSLIKQITNVKNNSTFLLIIFSVSVFVGGLTTYVDNKPDLKKSSALKEKSPEIKDLLSENKFKKKVELYARLIERIGPEQAQEELHSSGVPYTGQMHLLNHTVGDFIWNKFGPSGITRCRDYFSSSCYHGFILNAIGDGKIENINLVMNECKKTGSPPSYMQCAHAVGHGFLAYVGYSNLMEGLSLCDSVKKDIADFAVDYCYNGVFMENVWGLHEGRPSPDRWVSDEDMYYPCNYEGLTREHLPECWYNQAIYINNKFFEGDIVKVAYVCASLEEGGSQYMCFDGAFRSLHSMTESNVARKYEICSQMPDGWKEKCIAIQASASFQQGDRSLPFKICSDTKIGKKDCYEELFKMIKWVINSSDERISLCNKIPKEYRIDNCI
jgi:hypothetical protein